MPMRATSRNIRRLLLVAALAALTAGAAQGMQEKKDEKDQRKQCERKICELVVKKAPATGDVSCPLTKTWARKSIKDTSEARQVAWSFGDASCHVDLKLPRSLVVAALGAGEVKLELPLHTVKCEIEREKEITPVLLTFGPKILFKDGKAKKVWINLKDVEGPTVIKGLATTVAKLEDGVGLFQKDLVKLVNTFVRERCPEVVAGKQ
jgi:hypothetical protein